jgi:hypothetical protein
VQPALILALQLVVEDDAFDGGAALQETCLSLFAGAIELEVVFQFTLTRQAAVEGLVVFAVAVSVAFQKAAACLGQRDRLVAVPGHSRGLDQPLLTEVPKSPERGSAGLPSWSRRSRLETTRKAPTVASVRDSEPRSV